MDEYKHLLFNPKLTETDLVTNAGTCLLCRPGLCITISHGKDHMKKSKRIDGMVLNGCRKDTSFCHVEENKPTRYHYHCPICLYSNKEVGRLFLHINNCKSHPSLNRGCSRDRPTTSPAEDGSATGVHKPTTSRARDGSEVVRLLPTLDNKNNRNLQQKMVAPLEYTNLPVPHHQQHQTINHHVIYVTKCILHHI